MPKIAKFDKKIPMGSVPNCKKEIPAHHAIRWFKCKLKPPKNNKTTAMSSEMLISITSNIGGGEGAIDAKAKNVTTPKC